MGILVTGGTGLVGKALRKIKPNWVYVGSRDVDLMNHQQTFNFLSDSNFDVVIHLAAVVGGIKINDKHPETFFYKNNIINLNVISSAIELNIPRVLSAISLCAFPDIVDEYPFNESCLHDGPPAQTNLSYGYAKRLLVVHSNACRRQYNHDYSTFAPSNIYGPEDNFDFETSHFVSAMIRRFYEAKDGDTLNFWGTGKSLRQQLYVDDLAKIIPMLLEKHHTDIPIIIAPDENLSIIEMIKIIQEITNKDVNIKFDGDLAGQYRKDGSNKKLLELVGDFTFTPFRDGVLKTYKWYKNRIAHE